MLRSLGEERAGEIRKTSIRVNWALKCLICQAGKGGSEYWLPNVFKLSLPHMSSAPVSRFFICFTGVSNSTCQQGRWRIKQGHTCKVLSIMSACILSAQHLLEIIMFALIIRQQPQNKQPWVIGMEIEEPRTRRWNESSGHWWMVGTKEGWYRPCLEEEEQAWGVKNKFGLKCIDDVKFEDPWGFKEISKKCGSYEKGSDDKH